MAYDGYRRRDPQPIARGPELALASVVGGVLVLAAAALLGQDVAGAAFGGGWIWPSTRQDQVAALSALASGHPGRGLPPEVASRLPGRAAVYTCVAVCELLTVVLAAVAAAWLLRFNRADDPLRGMATRDQAAAVLGRGRLRQARAVIRPDLYGRRRDRTPRPEKER